MHTTEPRPPREFIVPSPPPYCSHTHTYPVKFKPNRSFEQ